MRISDFSLWYFVIVILIVIRNRNRLFALQDGEFLWAAPASLGRLLFMLVTPQLRLKGLGHEDFFVRSGVLESFEHDLNPQVNVTKAAIAAIQRAPVQLAMTGDHTEVRAWLKENT